MPPSSESHPGPSHEGNNKNMGILDNHWLIVMIIPMFLAYDGELWILQISIDV